MTALVCLDVERFVQTLPAQDRLVLALRYAEDLSPDEIASILRLSPPRVEDILRRLRTAVAEHFRGGTASSSEFGGDDTGSSGESDDIHICA
ncbi:MAG: sigma-70 family RNA polymerase sigma factor [Phycisphaerales bacterium]|nr:sigma-70 family RNA polymerase sigma factor [Phycisphaerales bacterium]